MAVPPKKAIPRPPRKSRGATDGTPATAKVPGQPAVAKTDLEAQRRASRQIAILAAQAGLEKKATGVEIIDVSGKVDYADFLVLMTGQSDRNVGAIAREVDESLGKAGFRAMSIEGLSAGQWVLIDFVDVVVHVFQRDVRSLYDLDGLWMDAGRVPLEAETAKKGGAPSGSD